MVQASPSIKFNQQALFYVKIFLDLHKHALPSKTIVINETFSHKLPKLFIILPSVACVIGPSVNPLQNRETQYVNIVLQCMYWFSKQPNMKGSHAWIDDKPSSVTTFSSDFSFQNLVFWNLFEHFVAKIIFKSIFPTFWIQILPHKFH